MLYPKGALGKDLNFFPLTGLQFGKWLSAFHLQNQLFLYTPDAGTLVFLAVHSEESGQVDSTFFLHLARKQVLKQFGRNSPFAAPTHNKSTHQPAAARGFLRHLSADYWGITAFEIKLKSIVGLDYLNTLLTYGSRIVIESKVCTQTWFPDIAEFCKHYNIFQEQLEGTHYCPVLAEDRKSFATKQMYPRHCRGSLEPELPQGVRQQGSRNHTLSYSTHSSEGEDMEPSQRPRARQKVDTSRFQTRNCTVIAYFDDPVLPFFMKELVMRPENKRVLRMYERGIPSWAVFLPSYGLPYRPWMRTVMAFLIFLVSFTTLLLGFYDLYKHIPMLRGVLYDTFGSVFEMFEEAVFFRLSMLFGWVFATSENVRLVVLQMMYPLKLAWGLVEFMLAPVKELIQASHHVLKVLNELLALLGLMLGQLRAFTFITLSLPYDFLYFCTIGLSGWAIELYSVIKNFGVAIRDTGKLLHANREVLHSLSVWMRIKDFWQNIFRHVLKGVTSVYNFTVYSTVNLYKYKESTWIACEEYCRANQPEVVRKVYQVLGFMLIYAVGKYFYRLIVI